MRRAVGALAVSVLLASAGSALALQAPAASPVAPAQSEQPTQVIPPELADQLATAAPDAPVTVFVHSTTIGEAVRAADAAGLQVVSRWSRIGVAVAVGTPAAIQRVALDPAVSYVEPDAPVELYLDTAHKATGADDARDSTFGLLEGGSTGRAFDGSGVSIAINDGGVDGTHPMFNEAGTSKVVRNLRQICPDGILCDEWLDVPDSDTMGAGGHGTHVAGIAAGYERTTTDGREVRGAAPGASLVALGSGAALTIRAAAGGLNWVLDHHANPCGDGSCPPIKVVNNSWGAGGGEFNPDDAISLLSDALVVDGVVVVFAAGNGDTTGDGGDGSDNRVSTYAQNPTPGVIAVANYDDGGTGSRDNALDSSSSRGLKTDPTTYPDIAAPGANITSACTYALPICRSSGDVTDPYYAAISGTSMAAPYIAGVVAVLVDANPALTPAAIEDLLEDNAYQFGASADYVPDPRNLDHTTSFDRGHGLVNVVGALAGALGRPVVGPGPACGVGAILDASGDATDIAVATGLPSTASEKTLDITAASVRTDPGTGALTFTVNLVDLGELPPTGAGGEFLRFYFTFAGTKYMVGMERLGGSAEVTVKFDLQTDGLVREVVAATLEGSFDPVANTVSATVPADAFNVWKPAELPVVDDGDSLSGLEVLSQRRVGVLTLTADMAAGGCPYIVGS